MKRQLTTISSVCDLLIAIEKQAEAATSGPWEYLDYRALDGTGIVRQRGQKRGFLGIVHNNDGEFLAACRVNLPRLCRVLRFLIDRMDDHDWQLVKVDIVRILNGHLKKIT